MAIAAADPRLGMRTGYPGLDVSGIVECVGRRIDRGSLVGGPAGLAQWHTGLWHHRRFIQVSGQKRFVQRTVVVKIVATGRCASVKRKCLV